MININYKRRVFSNENSFQLEIASGDQYNFQLFFFFKAEHKSLCNKGPTYLNIGLLTPEKRRIHLPMQEMQETCVHSVPGWGSYPGEGNGNFQYSKFQTPTFLPGKSHGQRSLEGYSPWGHKESEMMERLNTHSHISRD